MGRPKRSSVSEPQAHEIIWNLATAYVSSRCLHVVLSWVLPTS
jgi:hypothetical protein